MISARIPIQNRAPSENARKPFPWKSFAVAACVENKALLSA